MRETPHPATAAALVAWTGAALFLASLLFCLYSYQVRFGVVAGGADPMTAGAFDVALFTIFALHHSVAARPALKARLQRWTGLLERSLYTWTASLLFIAVCALWRPIPGELYELAGPAAFAGYLVQAAGLVLTIRSSARLDVLDLAGVRPVLNAGRGAARAEVALETHGLYGFVRHPLYFAWILMVFGPPHMTATRFLFAVVSTGYLAIAIPFEERSLVRRFGPEYRAYQQRVRWRLIPGLY